MTHRVAGQDRRRLRRLRGDRDRSRGTGRAARRLRVGDPAFRHDADGVEPARRRAARSWSSRRGPRGIHARDHAEGLTSSLANLAAYPSPRARRRRRQTTRYAAAHGSFSADPGGYVFLVDHGRVLLQMRAGTGTTTAGGRRPAAGHVESGETVLGRPARELAEEIGVEVAPSPTSSRSRRCTARRPTACRRPAARRVLRRRRVARRTVAAGGEGERARVVPLDACPTTLVHHERFALEGWRAGGLPAITAFGF